MKTMKLSAIFVSAVLLLAACGSNPEAQLESLKAERERINNQISSLEAQLAGNNNNSKHGRVSPVKVEPARNNEFRHYIEVQGNVESESCVNVPAESPGIVQRILVIRGEAVSRGQLLAELDASIIQSSIDQVETGLELATTMYERQKRLWDQKIGSEVQYLQARTGKESLEKQLATLNEQLKMTRITSPISGTVDEVIVREGEMAAPGFPAFRVVQLSNLKVRANLSENHITSVNPNDPVMVRFPLLNSELQLKVDAVSQVIDPNSRTFSIEVRIPQSETGIKPNMLAVLVVNNYVNHGAISVPLNSVQQNGHGQFLFVAENENGQLQARRRDVKTGLTYANRVEVLEGVKAGEKVIVFGHQNLADGALVQSIN
jgi:membrane fusion protein, multidrug efflux system